MPSVARQGQKVWRSLQELARREGQTCGSGDAAPAGQEFAEGASLPPDGPTRRRFLQLMAASAGLAGLTGCRLPKENILPYARRPPEITPGEPLPFATAMEIAGRAQGLVVTSYDGRPIKVDGNLLHPINQGGTDPFAQASVLDLYDADRSRNPVQLDRRGGKPTWFDRSWNELDEFLRGHFSQVRQGQGRGLYVLSEMSSSPSVAAMQERFLKAYPQARWTEYESTASDHPQAGSVLAFGQAYRTHYSLDKARVVVSLDSDFVMMHPASLRLARDFVRAHTPSSDNAWTMSRLYVVEPTFTNTGAMADNRLAAQACDVWPILCQLVIALVEGGVQSPALPDEVMAGLRQHASTPRKRRWRDHEPDKAAEGWRPLVQALSRDLIANRGRSVILVGDGQPPVVHALAHVLNSALGNAGHTLSYSLEPQPQKAGQIKGLRALTGDMAGGKVETLLILGGNPVYNAPVDLKFPEALAKIPTTVHLSDYYNETSLQCTWHIPRAHYLESWGDVRSYDGTYSVTQPLIAPLYDGRSTIEVLSRLAEEPPLGGYEIVRRTMRQQFAGQASDQPFEESWRKLLNDGVLAQTQYPIVEVHVQSTNLQRHLAGLRPAKDRSVLPELELIFHEDPRVYDGRFANNAWLQETPDTMTKITWDNAALVSPATAAALMIRHGQVVDLTLEKRVITAPVYVMPGQADGSVTVYLGYGRKAAGRVGNGVGVDAYPLRTTTAMHFGDGLMISPTARTHTFAMTQHYHDIDTIGRKGEHARLEEIATEMTLAEWKKTPPFAKGDVHSAEAAEMWKPVEYPGHRWGMTIDMHKCIGCNACAIACQAENNVPVVGREQVRRGRQMQWLRIDRYFRGETANPQVTFQPMFCVHCETAPCEAVCPVAATLHDADGLNLMVYNRCVGTRYCSNNCPYKVRRFNFYHWNKDISRLEAMVKNPDVTVRSRGVMEKCTYCVQRIQRAKIRAKNERRPIATDEFTTACAQACPTGALVFGNLDDPNATVTKLQRSSRSYAVLVELNTRPRSLHMVRLRNPVDG